jgi:5-methylcytosine-specific restriction endonuclease McrA
VTKRRMAHAPRRGGMRRWPFPVSRSTSLQDDVVYAILRKVSSDLTDPVLLGQRVVAVLETGRRTATYKLATLMALIDFSVEHLPADPTDRLVVPIPDLAARVLELYWFQVRPFDSHLLRQSTQSQARIIRATLELRDATRVRDSGTALSVAVLRDQSAYERAVEEVTLCLAQQPLPRLQRAPAGAAGDCFLYDDSFLHDHVSRRSLQQHGDAVELMPGVATNLAKLARLLKPTLEVMWVDDVWRMNRHLHAAPDVAGHLFGRDRVALHAVRDPLKEAFGATCFYCGVSLSASNPVDHVLPWSLLGINGLANLVLACARCNGDKRNALPSLAIVDRVLARDQILLSQVSAQVNWPMERERVISSARGVYRTQPASSVLWSGAGQYERLGVPTGHSWLASRSA